MAIIVPTGRIILEYLKENEKDVDEFWGILGVGFEQITKETYWKMDLNEEVLKYLEKELPSIPRTYWLNLEKEYRKCIGNEDLSLNITREELNKIAERFKFDEVFEGLGWSRVRQAIEMLKLLGLKTFGEFNNKYSNIAVDFMEDGGELEPIAIWLKLSEEEIDIQNDDISEVEFDKQKLRNWLGKFKLLACREDSKSIKKNCVKLCNRLGINLVINKAIRNSKVRGALTTVDGKPSIYISGRFKTHDHIWFAFMHEVGHLLLHYNEKETIISYEDEENNEKEKEASEFARDFFIDKIAYEKFISSSCEIKKRDIIIFAKEQKVLPGIVVGRLQHDGYLKMNMMNDLKTKIILD